ncbi:unnamed protein product [Cyclocybe aegerita]|uniref:SigF-like NTF2-like domain-containing protein n=1 Tax=Cyclocybe aegerita TaxID=1973307 RepID=A0A8S0WNN9_CYCAE|nr:unnamed protein product [Cyclocybe aegerita]
MLYFVNSITIRSLRRSVRPNLLTKPLCLPSQRSMSNSRFDLRDTMHFPVLKGLAMDNAPEHKISQYYRPTKHWCLLTEIVEEIRSTHPMYTVRDKNGLRFLVAFHHTPDNEAHITYPLGDLPHIGLPKRLAENGEPGKVMAFMYAVNHKFSDGLHQGIRVENLEHVQTFPCNLRTLLRIGDEVNKPQLKACHSCQKKAQLSCPHCSVLKYCGKTMEDPARDIYTVVYQLTATDSPDVQKAAVEKYMTPDVSFRHPLCEVKSSASSRDELLGIYVWYRVLSPKIDSQVNSVVFDKDKGLLYVEVVQWFKLVFLPITPAPARLLIRLNLRKVDGLFYIAEQEDFYHTDDFTALLVPPIVPFVKYFLAGATTASNFFARTANFFGYWRPTATVSEAESTPSEAGLYNKDD